MSERLPNGLRKHIRAELADVRKSGSLNEINQTENNVSSIRLSAHYASYARQLEELQVKINQSPDNSTDRAELTVKKYWLEYKISSSTDKPIRLKAYNDYLHRLESEQSELYDHLNEQVGEDRNRKPITRMIAIRNQVISPEEFKKR